MKKIVLRAAGITLTIATLAGVGVILLALAVKETGYDR